ncbi:hypothetical protein [Halarchaeum sp. P4]|uniref:hypothetical protein n=1 Tax=Halarchaeum sp. P4 TaxID=3421639 RepID=UPI003EBC6CBC
MTRVARRRRWLLAALLVVAVLQMPVSLVAAAPADAGGPVVAQAANNTTTTTVVHHRDPSQYEESGDIESLKRWLGGQLGSRLSESSLELSQSQYDTARSLLGDTYDQRLAEYVDVAGETETTQDDRTARDFRQAREEQQQYVSLTQRYRQVYERYEAARAAGNETAARRLARRLQQLATRIDRQQANVTDSYTAVANGTDVDVTAAINRTSAVATNVERTQSQVQQETFTRTRLTLAPSNATLSPAATTTFSGTLETRSGEPIANGTVVLAAANRTLATATTAADGTYTLAYRPVTLAATAETLTAQYQPTSASPYLGSNATTSVTVTTRQPTVSLDETPTTLRFGATARVSGTVTIDGTPLAGVPVRVAIGDGVVATARTDANGEFAVTPRLGARPVTGTTTITATAGRSGAAVIPAAASANATVSESATDLSVEATVTGETLAVASQLEASESGVAGQRLVVSANGTRLTTLTTNQRGWANASVTLPVSVRQNADALAVRVRYAGTGTNLAAAEATTTVSLPAPSTSRLTLTQAWILLGAFLVAALLFALAYALWRRDVAEAESDEAETPADPTPATPDEPLAARLLAQARNHLEADDPDEAVRTAYSAVRRTFDAEDADLRHRTHWEFYAALADGLAADERSALETLTRTYERATFAGQGATRADAETVLAAATELVEE